MIKFLYFYDGEYKNIITHQDGQFIFKNILSHFIIIHLYHYLQLIFLYFVLTALWEARRSNICWCAFGQQEILLILLLEFLNFYFLGDGDCFSENHIKEILFKFSKT